ncbi:MAG: tRNA (adenosine(37)-N6)-threonylcarbamoyltransferase complex ATPase subunit type 1 TsaE [Chloroflexi bacterium]|nr:tRNA (adenosine(37)-N6)-threonylcarbamoyltransferase complex ATPase subunit type 1 TsaE [Chloroflexota bacterium]
MIILENKFEHFVNIKETLEETVISNSLKDTIELGLSIGRNISKENIILLSGDLGSGKTELVRSIVKGSGSEGFVRSPTFVLINNYDGPVKITHCDFYRMQEGLEEEEIGIEEYFDETATLIEWPERIAKGLPSDCVIIKIYFTKTENQRKFLLYSSGKKSKKFIKGLE